MAQPSANENLHIVVRECLGQRIQDQRIGADLDIQIGPLDRPAPIAKDRTLEGAALAQ
jgi:hypothetical protein